MITKIKLPELITDKAAEAFIDEADLTEYDLSGLKPVRFEFPMANKNEAIQKALMEGEESGRANYSLKSLIAEIDQEGAS